MKYFQSKLKYKIILLYVVIDLDITIAYLDQELWSYCSACSVEERLKYVYSDTHIVQSRYNITFHLEDIGDESCIHVHFNSNLEMYWSLSNLKWKKSSGFVNVIQF